MDIPGTGRGSLGSAKHTVGTTGITDQPTGKICALRLHSFAAIGLLGENGQRSRSNDYSTVLTNRGSNPDRVKRSFSTAKRSPASLLLNTCQGSLPRVQWPGRQVDHSPPPSIEVKNGRSCTSTPQISFYAVDRNAFITHCV